MMMRKMTVMSKIMSREQEDIAADEEENNDDDEKVNDRDGDKEKLIDSISIKI